MEVVIVKCNDPLLWYANIVGQRVVVERVDEYYWSRDRSGYINIIHKHDAEVVDGEQ